MCGIYGIILSPQSNFNWDLVQNLTSSLALLSTSRGKEASGTALLTENKIVFIKEAVSAAKLMRGKNYQRLVEEGRKTFLESRKKTLAIMGHSRLVTNGTQYQHNNNQPVHSSGILAIHNGIVTNVDQLWRKHEDLQRETDLDTEVLLAMLRQNMQQSGKLVESIRKVYAEMEGAASLALFFSDLEKIVLVTNTGSLYTALLPEQGVLLFASEKYFLTQLAKDPKFRSLLHPSQIKNQKAFSGKVVDLQTLTTIEFDLNECQTPEQKMDLKKDSHQIQDLTNFSETIPETPVKPMKTYNEVFTDQYPENRKKVDALRRCTKCVLPETMPFIEFDEAGVCNYCRGYKPQQPLGEEALRRDLEPWLSHSEDPDLLITFSGGRDSSYGVHYVAKVMGLHPVTYTYDWGMITDLGRRNQMRMCGKLGLENILVSADLAVKRSNIRKNVEAWLKTPELGTIPLFMAGDKQYFYYANKVGEQTGCKMVMLCENPFEATFFKYGFCGIKPNFDGEHIYSLSLSDKIRMAAYYLGQYLRNPAYLNSSILDTLGAYASYYLIPHRFINFYNYILWDEETINKALISEYNWETASDTKSTWRIGDGTASFYNYIYYTMAGLTENDTFRSYQVRENMLTREEALAFVQRDNQPRYESIAWYCDLIGIDFNHAINTINNAKKLY